MDDFNHAQLIASHIATRTANVVVAPPRGARLLPSDEDLIDFTEADVEPLEPVPEIITSEDLAPVQTAWSPLGDGEHEFSNTHAISRSTAEDSPHSHPPKAIEQREIKLESRLVSPTHSVTVTGTFFSTLGHLLLNNTTGFLGTFTFPYDFTPATTWEDFVRDFRQQATGHGLPERVGREHWMTVVPSAKVVREKRGWLGGVKRVERVVVLEREGWRGRVGELVRGGVREVRVAYCVGEREGVQEESPKGRAGVETKGVGKRPGGMVARPTYPTNTMMGL
ncbi:hypothetical protein PRZ48_002923 [Zasmidium cellare]|uniref:Uncharacterized protein n=1 Tax=Zasmidium cellare TaxID=395010 RepID=A0ABR0EV29_ZASCE|nr:hypothetical protein PRZ48_002923 [Zasmidium cellare]